MQFIFLQCYYIITLNYISTFFGREFVKESIKLHFTSGKKYLGCENNCFTYFICIFIYSTNTERFKSRYILLKIVMYLLFRSDKCSNINLV